MRALLAGLLLWGWWWSAPAAAQMEPAVVTGPDAFILEEEDRPAKPPTPLPLAVSLVFDATTWARVGVSTAAAADLGALMGRGYYRLELLQLTLLAERSGKRLIELTARRDKDEGMRDIAKSLFVDFDPVYERATELAREVDARVERLDRVWLGSRPGAPEEPAPRKDDHDHPPSKH